MYHAIVIDQSFIDPSKIRSFRVFAIKHDGTWKIYGVEIDDRHLDEVIEEIQDYMKPNEPWYAHAYNDEELIVIFKNKVFTATSDPTSWQPAVEYGVQINIPREQLNFKPVVFNDEAEYFKDK